MCALFLLSFLRESVPICIPDRQGQELGWQVGQAPWADDPEKPNSTITDDKRPMEIKGLYMPVGVIYRRRTVRRLCSQRGLALLVARLKSPSRRPFSTGVETDRDVRKTKRAPAV